MDMLKTMQTLCACNSPAGQERAIAAVLTEMATPYVDEITRDTMGNLIAHKKGTGPKLMFAAHMDSIGCMVTYIEKEGFLRFGKIGGLHINSILHSSVRFANGTRGVISADKTVKEKDLTFDDLYIDIGATSDDDARTRVEIGDTAVYDTATYQAGTRMVSPYMDNRISCVVLLMAMAQMQESDNDLYFVFTAQEEVGTRGATTAAYSIDPDYGIAIDVTIAGDEMGAKYAGSSVFGGGAAIKVMDRKVICHPEMVSKLRKLAEDNKIPFQMDIIKAGGTDAGPIHTTRAGVVTGGVSIPCRYIHSPSEMVETADVEACAQLIAAFAQTKH